MSSVVSSQVHDVEDLLNEAAAQKEPEFRDIRVDNVSTAVK